jgi:putative transposase
MPRMARVVIAGEPHHVTQRGNRREKVFHQRGDYQRYLWLLGDYAGKHGLAVQAYCLMPNHVHLIAVPREADSLALALKPVHLRYAQEINKRLGVSGVLWQGRFYSCPMDDHHFWAAVRYVERNPVRAGLVDRAEDYPWSSAAVHCGLRTSHLLTDLPHRPEWLTDWSTWLRDEDDPETLKKLRWSTRTGRPAGGRAFIDRLERLVGRILRPQKGGRPRTRRKHG